MSKQQVIKLGVSVCVARNNQVLLVKRGRGLAQGLWSLPGGHVEYGETLIAAAHRELQEETAITADIVSLVDIVDLIATDHSYHYVLAVYFAKWRSGTAIAADDALSVQWAGIDELAAIEMTLGTADTIKQAWQKFSPQH